MRSNNVITMPGERMRRLLTRHRETNMTNRRAGAGILAAVLAAGLTGCTTVSLQDAAPTPLDLAAPAPVPDQSEPPQSPQADPVAIAAERPAGPVNEGQYPNLNLAPVRHEDRISTSTEAADIARLTRQREALALDAADDGSAAAAEAERLRQLGATHADNALREIEKP